MSSTGENKYDNPAQKKNEARIGSLVSSLLARVTKLNSLEALSNICLELNNRIAKKPYDSPQYSLALELATAVCTYAIDTSTGNSGSVRRSQTASIISILIKIANAIKDRELIRVATSNEDETESTLFASSCRLEKLYVSSKSSHLFNRTYTHLLLDPSASAFASNLPYTSSDIYSLLNCINDYATKGSYTVNIEDLVKASSVSKKAILSFLIQHCLVQGSFSSDDISDIDRLLFTLRSRKLPIVYHSDSVVITSPFLCYNYLPEALDYGFRTSEPKVSNSYLKRRNDTTELIVHDILSLVFPEDCILRNCYYESDGKSYELDSVVSFQDALLFLEIKSNLFTSASPQRFQSESLKDDYHKTVGKAKSQASIAADSLRRCGQLDLLDRKGNLLQSIKSRSKLVVIKLAITLDWSSARPDESRRSNLDHLIDPLKDEWTLSISDLDTVGWLFNNPLLFVNYFLQRLMTVKHNKNVKDVSETVSAISYFMDTYDTMRDIALASRDNRKSIVLPFYNEYDSILEKLEALREQGKTPADLALSRPLTHFQYSVLHHALTSCASHANSIASVILGCRSSVALEIESTLQQVRIQSRSGAISNGPLFTYTEQLDCSSHLLSVKLIKDRNKRKASIDHSRRNLIKMKCIDGVVVFMDRYFEVIDDIVYISRDDSYFHDTQCNTAYVGAQAVSAKRGRNDPCICGSGKKYKRCCGKRE